MDGHPANASTAIEMATAVGLTALFAEKHELELPQRVTEVG